MDKSLNSRPDDVSRFLAAEVLTLARDKHIMLVTAESCTGGRIIGTLTDIPGSSDVIDRGFITYSNKAKMDMLNVPSDVIKTHGAVSQAVAIAMAEGACQNSEYEDDVSIMAISVTGVAGPGGGSIEKPVGTVWFGLTLIHKGQKNTISWVEHFKGHRADIRQATIDTALTHIKDQLIAI
jgi:nicotinamide-nucleotide amidase